MMLTFTIFSDYDTIVEIYDIAKYVIVYADIAAGNSPRICPLRISSLHANQSGILLTGDNQDRQWIRLPSK